jgi:hypothetical protein
VTSGAASRVRRRTSKATVDTRPERLPHGRPRELRDPLRRLR